MFDETNTDVKELTEDWTTEDVFSGVHIGRIVKYEVPGDVWVAYDGGEPIQARSVAHLNQDQLIQAAKNGQEVLLLFEQNDPNRPIVIALMKTQDDNVSIELDARDAQQPKEAMVDGETVTIEAKKQLTLKCGKGTIRINKDGKIIVRGTNLFSRSSGPNRIKGASVQIN